MSKRKKAGDLLEAIAAGDPCSWSGLSKALGLEGMTVMDVRQIFRPADESEDVGVVEVINRERLAYLQTMYPPSADHHDRVSAAMAGDSHLQGVTGSLLVIDAPGWHEPLVAVCRDGLTWPVPPPGKTHLLLVENMENFLAIESTLAFLRTHCGWLVDSASTLVAFGSGNQAAKACHGGYYGQFDQVSCLFDVDEGGIRTYQSIRDNPLLPAGFPVRFLVPTDIQERLERSRWRLSEKQRVSLRGLILKHPELQNVIQAMYNLGKKLEQETYLEGL